MLVRRRGSLDTEISESASTPTNIVACGIDVGSLRTPASVAWLRDREFLLDLYVPSAEEPLPSPPPGVSGSVYYALDAPQGLPSGRARREADRAAKTPTRVLPASREELATWKLYRGVIEAGLEVFWSVWERGLGRIPGLRIDPGMSDWVMETYTRYVVRRLWPGLAIPSKRQTPLLYVDAVWLRVQRLGLRCPSVIRPSVDQVDAMLCALAALAWAETGEEAAGTVGHPPSPDEDGRVLREGFIVSP